MELVLVALAIKLLEDATNYMQIRVRTPSLAYGKSAANLVVNTVRTIHIHTCFTQLFNNIKQQLQVFNNLCDVLWKVR
mgnify:FL=1